MKMPMLNNNKKRLNKSYLKTLWKMTRNKTLMVPWQWMPRKMMMLRN